MIRAIIAKTYNRGFTLIELLVVIAVVGVLAGAVVVIINPTAQLARARDAKRKVDIRTIRDALQRYQIDNNGFYNTSSAWVLITGTDAFSTVLKNGGYLRSVSKDPQATGGNWPCEYYYLSDGVTYMMHFCLETTSDPIAANCSLSGTLRYCHPSQDFFIAENGQ